MPPSFQVQVIYLKISHDSDIYPCICIDQHIHFVFLVGAGMLFSLKKFWIEYRRSFGSRSTETQLTDPLVLHSIYYYCVANKGHLLCSQCY